MTIQERKNCRNSRTKALLKFRVAENRVVCIFTPTSGFFLNMAALR